MIFFRTKGETDDHLTIWLPDKKLVIAGDNVYNSFPNLYTLRGSPNRDAVNWYKSVQSIKELKPEYLLMCHSFPLLGREKIENALTLYGDAIKFVHDQTVRNMNLGKNLDLIVEIVKLPQVYENVDMLKQIYGKVEWSVRGIYNGYVGWFDGKVESLTPIPEHLQAKYTKELLSLPQTGGPIKQLIEQANFLLKRAVKMFADKQKNFKYDLAWALHVCKIARKLSDSRELKGIEVNITTALLNSSTSNIVEYNLYYTHLQRLTNHINVTKEYLNPIKHLPLNQALEVLPLRFKAERCAENERHNILIEITDEIIFSVYLIRNCIIEQQIFVYKPSDIESYNVIPMSSKQFREVFSKSLNINSLGLKQKEHEVLKYFIEILD